MGKKADIHKKLKFYAYIHKRKGTERNSNHALFLALYQTTKDAICKEFLRKSKSYFRTMMD